MVEGYAMPLDTTEAVIFAAIRAAVAEERARCAAVARSHWDRHGRDCGRHTDSCIEEIARAIEGGS